jgi:predicted nuclease of predicted toxin-antitoxin system
MSATGDLASGSDRAIWQYARDHGFIIVTKDEDFHRLSVLSVRRNEIDRFAADKEAAFLALA